MNKEELKKVIDLFKEETAVPVINLTPDRSETTVFDSKLGGKPYLPPGFSYPHHLGEDSEHKPLALLAQLNFSELPQLPGFPDKGILQFYIAHEESDGLYGLDLDDQLAQKGFRVVYHADIIDDEKQLQEQPELVTSADVLLPFDVEFKLDGELAEMGMTAQDFRFDSRFMETYQKSQPTGEKKQLDLDDEAEEYLYEEMEGTGHRIGGTPFFTQTDPREYNKALRDHTVLLLQIDTDFDGEDQIMWGDCGVANFFIRPDDLEKLDFSKVLYNWDCC